MSPPIRILLAGSLLFIVCWFVFLRPGPVEPVATPAAGLGNAVDAAKQASSATTAAANANAGNAAAPEAAAPVKTAPRAGVPTSGSAPETSKVGDLALPPSVAKAVKQKKVLVMLFWNRNAIDDQAVRRELRGIDRHKGKVKVHVAAINDVARYASITRGVNMEQSPTIVVAKGKTADALVGYVDSKTIDQTVSDVIRSTRKK